MYVLTHTLLSPNPTSSTNNLDYNNSLESCEVKGEFLI